MINIRTRGCPRWWVLRSTSSTFANRVPAFDGIGTTSQNEINTALTARNFVTSSVTAQAAFEIRRSGLRFRQEVDPGADPNQLRRQLQLRECGLPHPVVVVSDAPHEAGKSLMT